MRTPIAIVGAPSSIGIRPYDEGGSRRLDLAPRALREQGLVARLAAHDRGDVTPPPYRDFERRGIRPRNESDVGAYSRALAEQVAAASGEGAFVVVLGGDCSIVLGCLLGARQTGRPRVGLVYVDAHADSPEPNGLGLDELTELLAPLVRHPRALGLELTIYDPGLDSDQSCAGRLADLLERVLVGDAREARAAEATGSTGSRGRP